jgi:transaldolase / glucose-6-phosphate isomerase
VPILKNEDISIFGGKAIGEVAVDQYDTIGGFANNFIERARAGNYIALLPYFLLTPGRVKNLQKWRQQMRDELKVATTLLNGPRYLHSTGQLHKGGPNTGLYIILTGDEDTDLPIPEEKFGFATLHKAQALGDFRSLDDKGRRIIRIHLGKDIDTGLDKLLQSIWDANNREVPQEVL